MCIIMQGFADSNISTKGDSCHTCTGGGAPPLPAAFSALSNVGRGETVLE